ncbi:MAG TPA: TraR/DksA family transcriptional regulator [Ramlibacter sp.]|nr:TraR/DksA family transcriptional regulator [Ramlibacter sp.]
MSQPLLESFMLDESQRGELQQLLEHRERDIKTAIGGLRSDLSEQAGNANAGVRDSIDIGDARMMSELDATQLARYERELIEVRAARDRMRDGSYGVCEECAKPIAFGRLKAVPTARLCLIHEEEAEKAARGA